MWSKGLLQWFSVANGTLKHCIFYRHEQSIYLHLDLSNKVYKKKEFAIKNKNA